MRVRIPKLRVKEYPHSPTARYVIEGLRVQGKRKRFFFRTKAEAELELARIKTKRAREGQDALAIPDSLRIAARDCAALLAPYKATITEATRFYITHLEKLQRSISLEGLVSEYQASKRRANLSEVHLADLNYRLGRFVRSFGHEPVRALSPQAIEDWLHGLGLSPKSYNNFRSRLFSLFSYAQKRHYLDSNPLEAVAQVKAVGSPPEIFTPEELSAVLSRADPVLRPALVIGAFAGLRTAELLRLSWTEVDLMRGFVEVSATKSKTARRRLIPLADNLLAWLSPYIGRTGKVYLPSAYHYHEACREVANAAGLSRWPKNGLRHSYASYHLARHQNAPELSLHLGHTSPQMVFAHYRELVHPDEAARYWAIRPPTEAQNVIPLKRTEGQA
jgi:integrase